MSGVSLPVTRPNGRAIVVGNPAARFELADLIQRMGYGSTELDDPYAAMAELCRRPLAYRALLLSLGGIYREELSLIPAIKKRFPHIEIWLTHTDGRAATLAEAMRMGADGLFAEDGLHRLSIESSIASDPAETFRPLPSATVHISESRSVESDTMPPNIVPESSRPRQPDPPDDEPVLTAEELRALLQEQPSMPMDDPAD